MLFQVASQDTFGTLSAIVKRRTSNKQVGFLTNRHVAVDLDYPNQKMFHPLPPDRGPGVYLGAVERATSFITDDFWYGIYAGTNPGIAITTYLIDIRIQIRVLFAAFNCSIYGYREMLSSCFVYMKRSV
jgi:hypothetical protein